ncbi:hypothetical protein [Roseofilum sp. Guam]|nr:hypothetical protein [Roseofilum sp. Guam]MBP0031304.1 hypothetical protein [Roseofilum sp. Guam]
MSEDNYRSCYPNQQHLGQGLILKANAAIAFVSVSGDCSKQQLSNEAMG